MSNLISAGDMLIARRELAKLLTQRASIYRPDINGVIPATPIYSNVPVSVEMVNRLANPSIAGGEGEEPQTPIRFDLRFLTTQDIRARDQVSVTSESPPQDFTVVGVRTPAEYTVFQFADAMKLV